MPILTDNLNSELTNYARREKLKNATRRNRCPICNGTGCGVNSQIVLCWRVEAGSTERARSGAFLHFRNGYNPFIAPIITPMDPKASPELIAKIYDSLLDCLVLEDKHFQQLTARGLTQHTIITNRYRSTPTKLDGQIVCKYLADLYNLDNVPGFYQDETRRMNIKGSGVFIPYRNIDGTIRGMQVRPDRGTTKYFWFSSVDLYKGASSGSFVHYARPDIAKSHKEIYITEGGLKADCIAELGGVGVAAIAGVTAVDYNTIVSEIKMGLPEVKKTILCFDIDWKTNPHVKEALLKLTGVMEKSFVVEIEEWNDKKSKGFDDYLLAKRKQSLI